MNPHRITSDLVRATLRDIRAGRTPTELGILESAALRRWLESERATHRIGSDAPDVRDLASWLGAIVARELARARGSKPVGLEDWSGRMDPDLLRDDFAASHPERQAWSVLQARYFAVRTFQLRAIAAEAGFSRRTIRRRQLLGYELLAECLQRAESDATAVQTKPDPQALPNPATRFIGRERELGDLRGLLSQTRLLTLVGPGGIGKSRLALALAESLAPDLAHGASWVDLAGVHKPSNVAESIARQLRVAPRPGTALEDTLTEALSQRLCLLVLDNGEHVAGELGPLALRLVSTCPNLQVIVTSRRLLETAHETAYRVPPLSQPPAGQYAGSESLVHFDAPRLFVDRIKQTAPELDLDPVTTMAVTSICRRLEGAPLAIELAAARSAKLGIQEVDRRLRTRVHWLAAERVGLRPVHQRLRASLEWSIDLLGKDARSLLARLSLFRGGFGPEDAVAVGATGATERATIPRLVNELATHSLIECHQRVDGPGWRMLEPVREVALERLQAAGELEAVRDRHLDNCLALARAGREALLGARQALALARLEEAEPDFWEALRNSRTPARIERGLRLASSLDQYLYLRGRYEEGWRRLSELLSQPLVEVVSAAAVAQVRAAAGGFAALAGAPMEAESLLEPALETARASGDLVTEATALHHLATVAYRRSQLDHAAELLWEAVRLRRERSLAEVAHSLHNLSLMEKLRGDLRTAEELLAEALRVWQDNQDRHGIAMVHSGLGNLALDNGDFDRARHHHAESLAVLEEIDDRHGMARQLVNLGSSFLEQGAVDSAAEQYREALSLWRALGDRGGIGLALGALAEVSMLAGNLERAGAHMADHIEMTRKHGSLSQLLDALVKYADLCAARGRHADLLRVAAAVDRARREQRIPASSLVSSKVHQAVETAHTVIGQPAGRKAWAEGAAMGLDGAVALALGQSDEPDAGSEAVAL